VIRRVAVPAVMLAVGSVAPPAAVADAVPRGPTRQEAWTARIVLPTTAYAGPHRGRVVARLATHARWAGGPHRLLVLAARRDTRGRRWIKVRLHARPNDAAGWIVADRAVVARTRWRVELDLSARRISVRRSGRVVRRFAAVIGAPATPTPRGLFAVAEKVRQPSAHGFLGPWALHLTAHSDVLDDYGGGPGRVAIHGRGGASLLDPLGSAASHGCIRIANRQIRFLNRVLVPGAPVKVRA
jgi:L,D-transpeptidase catalytic domain